MAARSIGVVTILLFSLRKGRELNLFDRPDPAKENGTEVSDSSDGDSILAELFSGDSS